YSLVISTLVVGASSLTIFVLVEGHARNPMLPLTLFRSPDFSGANLMTFFLYTALGGSLFFVPLNLIQVQGYSATAAGGALVPFFLFFFFFFPLARGLVEK